MTDFSTDPEEWTCPDCGRKENDEPPHSERDLSDEIAADVTCENVYLLRDDGYGIALTDEQFEEVIELYEKARSEA